VSYNKEYAIASQSAGAQAATIFAALIANANTPADMCTTENYDLWRTHIFEGTLRMAEVEGPTITSGSSGSASVNQAPTPGAPNCTHGSMVWREGSSAKGPWRGWFCSLPRERKDEQCSPRFVK